MDNIAWIFKKKSHTETRRNILINRFCELVNEHEEGLSICRTDSSVVDEFNHLSEEEIEDLVEEVEEYYRKSLQIIK
tara:strand:- start:42 stop:272 length:231 start_codon:yes stop_codon:yes gene_type:complete